MLCQRCQSRDAIEQDGLPVSCYLFGEIEGYFCGECLLALQRPYEDELKREITAWAPELTEADLARMPDQMLKFTLCLPIPRQ